MSQSQLIASEKSQTGSELSVCSLHVRPTYFQVVSHSIWICIRPAQLKRTSCARHVLTLNNKLFFGNLKTLTANPSLAISINFISPDHFVFVSELQHNQSHVVMYKTYAKQNTLTHRSSLIGRWLFSHAIHETRPKPTLLLRLSQNKEK